MRKLLWNFYKSGAFKIVLGAYLAAIIGSLAWYAYDAANVQKAYIAAVQTGEKTTAQLSETAQKLNELQNEDQVVKNASLSAQIKSIQEVFESGVELFDTRQDLAKQGAKTESVDVELAKFLSLLSKKDYDGAKQQLQTVKNAETKLSATLAPKTSVAAAPESNVLPGSGYSRQTVATSRGSFVVAMVVAPGAKVIVDTASDSNCGDNCPVLPLAEYVSRNGGFAGINGAYFCPPDYARCQGKVNTFDTLAVNGRSKAVLNKDNNVYSVVPLVAAYGNKLSFYSRTLDWGVDTSSTGALANHPMLLRDGNLAFDEGSIEAYQRDGKGPKGFVGTKDGTIVIGHVLNATVPEEAEALKTLGLQNALNLDGGGSSALWYSGSYKVGPGRLLPTAIVLTQ